ncbi:MAG: sigma-54 dependent transcriptional regulator [Pirellulales bacterium]
MTSTPGHVLIVDDEESICWGLKRLLTEEGHEVSVASTAEQALALADKRTPDLVVMDVRLPGIDGLTAMKQLSDRVGPVPVVVITAFGNLETAVAAVEQGAVDYLTKPFDLDEVAEVLHRALRGRRADAKAETPAPSSVIDGDLLGASPAMQQVFKRIAIVAATDMSVLVTGESGTGKELVARAIHRHSRRSDRPFVPVHLAALSPTLVESELFGHVRGAFTDAVAGRGGLLELADDATAFFDEAGDIPLAVQAKLLRVLEQRELTPVGTTTPRPCDFRVIAATHRDLRRDVAEGTFRQDLYFRLAAFEIHIPPLRQRKEDIPLLAEYFLRQSRVNAAGQTQLTPAAIDELCRRTWVGNARELRSAIDHGAVLARGGPIDPEHLPPAVSLSGESPATLEGSLAESVRAWAAEELRRSETIDGTMHERMLRVVEPALLGVVLQHTGDNRVAAADILGIHRATLRKKLK